MTVSLRLTAVAALAAAAVAVPLAMSMAQSDPIAARKALFQSNRTAMGAVKAVIDANGATAGAEAPALTMVANSQNIAALFPAGSDKGDTKAKPEIWAKFDDFKSKAANFGTAAENIAAAAKSGDMNKLKAAFGAAGGACKACHDDYRAG